MQGLAIEASTFYDQLASMSENTPPSEPRPGVWAARHLSEKGQEWREDHFDIVCY